METRAMASDPTASFSRLNTSQPAATPPAQAPVIPPTPTQVYSALQLQRNQIDRLLEDVRSQRAETSRSLRQGTLADVDRKGLEQQIVTLDARIAELNKQLAVNELEIAKVAAIPGAVPPPPVREPPVFINQGPDVEALMVAGALGVVFLFGTIVLYERRLMKRWSRMLSALPANLVDRLTRVEAAVDDVRPEARQLGDGTPYFGAPYSREDPERDADLRAKGESYAGDVAVRSDMIVDSTSSTSSPMPSASNIRRAPAAA
jgi:hypothetical protein